jgi:hypothetical protein
MACMGTEATGIDMVAAAEDIVEAAWIYTLPL